MCRIVDATSTYLYHYLSDLSTVPGNKEGSEPVYLTQHTLKALQPGARIIALLREPGERYETVHVHVLLTVDSYYYCTLILLLVELLLFKVSNSIYIRKLFYVDSPKGIRTDY